MRFALAVLFALACASAHAGVPNGANIVGPVTQGHVICGIGGQNFSDCGSLATVSITQFGDSGTCNGDPDDSAAFQKASTTLTSGALLIPGTCVLSNAEINWGNVSLIGISPGKSIIKLKSGSVFSSSIPWLAWGGRSAFAVQNITFDLNGATVSSGSPGILSFSNDTAFAVSGNRFINAGSSNFLYISAGAISGAFIGQNYISQPLAYAAQNEGVNISCAAGASTGVNVTQNVLINTGMDICAEAPNLSFNEISGWHFGAGITIEQNSLSFAPRIIGNHIFNGVNTPDVNNTQSIGIEDWAANSIISENLLQNNGGNGIDIGGQNSLVENNQACDNNQSNGVTGSGVVGRYQDSTYNANGSTFIGNSTTCSTGTTQIYGYTDQSSSLGNINMGQNSWKGLTAAVRFLGAGPASVSQYGPQVSSTPFTVATLPTCNAAALGASALVTDLTSPTYGATLTGGGSVKRIVLCNGSAWNS